MASPPTDGCPDKPDATPAHHLDLENSPREGTDDRKRPTKCQARFQEELTTETQRHREEDEKNSQFNDSFFLSSLCLCG
jgi:hypothetical protein